MNSPENALSSENSWAPELLARWQIAALSYERLPRNPIDADRKLLPGRRRDPLMVLELMRRHGDKAPCVVERVGLAYGCLGRWVCIRLRKQTVQYWFALRACFSGCRVICLALDGSSVSGIDTTLACLLAKLTPDDPWIAGWAPPQELHENLRE